jgi:hypothetical protein
MNEIKIRYKHFADRERITSSVPSAQDYTVTTEIIDETAYKTLYCQYRNQAQQSENEEYKFSYNGENRTSYLISWEVYTIELFASESLLQMLNELIISGDVRVTYTVDGTEHVCDKTNIAYFGITSTRIPGTAKYKVLLTYRVRVNETDYTDYNQVTYPYRIFATNTERNGNLFADFADFDAQKDGYLEYFSIFAPIEQTGTTNETTTINETEKQAKAVQKYLVNQKLFVNDSDKKDLERYLAACNYVGIEQVSPTTKTTVTQDITVTSQFVTTADGDFSELRVGQSIEINSNYYVIVAIAANNLTLTLDRTNEVTAQPHSSYGTFILYDSVEQVEPEINQVYRNHNEVDFTLTYEVYAKYNLS